MSLTAYLLALILLFSFYGAVFIDCRDEDDIDAPY